MARFSRSFLGVKQGEIYPTEFAAGDECPEELAGAARIVGALSGGQENASASGNGTGKPEAASVKRSK